MFEKSKLKKWITYYRYHQRYLNDLISVFNLNNYNYALVGDFIRWALSDPKNKTHLFKSFDIIVDIPLQDLESLLKTYQISFTRNSPGVFKLKNHPDDSFNIPIEICTLESYKPFEQLVKAHGVVKNINKFRTFKNIPKVMFLSISGATYWVNKNKLYVKDLKKTLFTNVIHLTDDSCLNFPNVNRKDLTAKLLFYRDKLGFEWDENCKRLVTGYMRKHNLGKLREYLVKTYPDYYYESRCL